MLQWYFTWIAVWCISGVWALTLPHAFSSGLEGDTLRKMYVNGAISHAITPWHDGARSIYLYDLKGRHTYTFLEKQGSDIALSYYPNGAVISIEIKQVIDSLNHIRFSKITFGATNDPEWKAETLHDRSGTGVGERKKYHWHIRDKIWIQQEIITCQPHPDQPEK